MFKFLNGHFIPSQPSQPYLYISGTLFCWGINEVPEKGNVHTPCTFLVTDETMPRPPANCKAIKNSAKDIIVKCEKGHNGGLPQVKPLYKLQLLILLLVGRVRFLFVYYLRFAFENVSHNNTAGKKPLVSVIAIAIEILT